MKPRPRQTGPGNKKAANKSRPKFREERPVQGATSRTYELLIYFQGCMPRLHCSNAEASAAIEHIVAQILHFEDCRVGASGGRLQQMRLGDLADDDVVIALFDD